MKLGRRRLLQLVGAATVAAGWPAVARALGYPARPVRVIVTFAPGGAPDVVARIVAAAIGQPLGGSVIVENRPGANGIVGMQAVAAAAADGYTLLSVPPAFAINPSVYKTLPFDIFRDFAPVANIGISAGYLVLVRPGLPVHSIAELIAYAKTHRVLYGSPGVGNTLHLAAALFAAKAGVEMQHVPYHGAGEVITALLGNTVDLAFVTTTSAHYAIDGQLRAIGFSGKTPFADMPDVPLVSATLPGFEVVGSWQGWFAPAKTPPAIIDRLNTVIRTAVHAPKVKVELAGAGYEPTDMTPAEFETFLHAEATRYEQAAKAARIEPQ